MCGQLIDKSPLQSWGQILLVCFSKANNHDATRRHDNDTNGGT